jgi:hypothetical protein
MGGVALIGGSPGVALQNTASRQSVHRAPFCQSGSKHRTWKRSSLSVMAAKSQFKPSNAVSSNEGAGYDREHEYLYMCMHARTTTCICALSMGAMHPPHIDGQYSKENECTRSNHAHE